MTECPVCGYNPEPPIVRLDDKALIRNQLLAYFRKNGLQRWWTSQPYEVCGWLEELISPNGILDVGCGDGRWVPAIREFWPDAHYCGIDRLEDHILNNQENMPDLTWIHGELSSHAFDRYYDTLFLMGTLNPKLNEQLQEKMFKKIECLKPDNVVCLFDMNQTGQKPHDFLTKYELKHTHVISDKEKNDGQYLVVWLFKR